MIKRAKWYGLAIASAAALAALSLTGVAPLSAKAAPLFTSTWVDGPTAVQGPVPPPTPECLGVLGGNMTNGTPVVTWTCNGHPDQTWEFTGTPGQTQGTLENSQNPSKCLGVLAGATSDGSNLVIWDCNGHPDQLWGLVPFSAPRNGPFGCFVFENSNTNGQKVMGALGGNPTDGTQAVLWDNLSGQGHLDQAWCPE
jgi:hypothetical protein